MTYTTRPKRRVVFVLSLIIGIGGLLRFGWLSMHDVYTDEALLGVRAIGMMDYVAASYQTTPWQWVTEVPWWMHLSFHDHPLLFFLFQHAGIALFGETAFALRFFSALFGTGTIFLVFLLGRRLCQEKIGLIAAALVAVSSYYVWVSRLGLQDGVAIFFLLLALLFWIHALDQKNNIYWIFFGVVFGMAVLIKLTTLILFPILLLYALLFRYPIHRLGFFWLAIGIFFLITAPITLYNLFLFDRFHHFDFQFSAFFGQEVPAWSVRVGREYIGGISTRFFNSFRALAGGTSPIFLFFSGAGFMTLLLHIIRGRAEKSVQFLFGATLITWLWFFVIGGTYRFVVMIIPWLALLIGRTFFSFWQAISRRCHPHSVIGSAVLCIVVFSELFFTVNTVFALSPIGRERVHYAQIRQEMQSFGFNEFNFFLDDLLLSHVSSRFGTPAYDFLADVQQGRLEHARAEGKTPLPIVVVYDTNMPILAKLWTFQRRSLYDGWIMMSTVQFFETAGDDGRNFFGNQGIETIMYVSAFDPKQFGFFSAVSTKEQAADERMDAFAAGFGAPTETIVARDGREAFAIYRIQTR